MGRRTRKVLGCIVLPIVILLFLAIITFGYVAFTDWWSKRDTMLSVFKIEEDRDCRLTETWYLKTDGTCLYEYDKGSNGHQQESCGNDFYQTDCAFDRVRNSTALKVTIVDTLTIDIDVKHLIITPLLNGDTLEVNKVEWERIIDYLK